MEKNHQSKKSWYKKWWIWIIIIIVLIGVAGASGGNKANKPTTTSNKPSASAPATTETTKWDLQVAYDKIQTGMTKAQVETATGKKSDNCTSSDVSSLGSYETCQYGTSFGDKGTITVTYTDGAVSSKTKTEF